MRDCGILGNHKEHKKRKRGRGGVRLCREDERPETTDCKLFSQRHRGAETRGGELGDCENARMRDFGGYLVPQGSMGGGGCYFFWGGLLGSC